MAALRRDGENHNLTWNCGTEGETAKQNVLRLRQRQMRNLAAALLLSHGVPMILMGDEYGHSKVWRSQHSLSLLQCLGCAGGRDETHSAANPLYYIAAGSVEAAPQSALPLQGGNNNTYCHDSPLNWFNWEQAAADTKGFARYFLCLVNFRCES